MATKKKSNLRYILGICVAVGLLVGGYLALIMFGENIYCKSGQEKMYTTVATGSSVDDIAENLDLVFNVKHPMGFRLVAKILDLEHHIYPGLYELQNGMSAFEAVRLFRSGKRATVRLSITNARHYEEVLELASEKFIKELFMSLIALRD